MNDYQQEQLEALQRVRHGLARFSDSDLTRLSGQVGDYLRFRHSVDDFLNRYFSDVCTQTCYLSRTSACCSKDGIIVFFADTVVNALHATTGQLDCLEATLKGVNEGHRCIYLTPDGCMWTIRPVVCAMFMCDRALDTVFGAEPEARLIWEALRRQEKSFRWPDRLVLFDHLEDVFMDLGYRSSLMHLHLSPGLLRVKKEAGLI